MEKKTIIDRLIDDLDECSDITEHIVVSNHKFISNFELWMKNREFKHKITILDDGSTNNENRLGAVKDIAFAINKLSIDESIIVLAGDNVLDFSLRGFIDFYKKYDSSVIMRHYEKDHFKLQKTGVAILNDNNKVLEMQEKPKVPKSNWAVPPFYIYKKEDLEIINKAIKDKLCGTDAPGDFISWFCRNYDLYAWEMEGNRYDIGDLKSYESAKKLFSDK